MWGTQAITFVNGAVLTAGEVVPTVRVQGGRIDGLGVAPGRDDLVVDLEESVVVPGLINAHNHLELNSFPRLRWCAKYANVREWIADFQPRSKPIRSLPQRGRIRSPTGCGLAV